MLVTAIGRIFICIVLVFGLMTPVAAQTSSFEVDKRYVHVMQGQTVFELVMSLYPDYREHWLAIVDAFVTINPQAFLDRDPDRIIEGARLEVPRDLMAMGTVSELTGDAYRINVFGEQVPLEAGSSVHVGDQVITSRESEAVIDAIDEARLRLRRHTRLSIIEYKLAALEKDDRSVLELLQGGLRAVSGKIGTRSPEQYALMTPMATIGVRGTDYAVRLCEPGQCKAVPELDIDAAPGLYVSVLQGQIEVANNAGGRTVQRGDYFYVPEKSKAPQRLYERPRLVFNDAELAQLPTPAPRAAPASEPEAAVAMAPVAENPKVASVSWVFILLLTLFVLRRGELYLSASERINQSTPRNTDRPTSRRLSKLSLCSRQLTCQGSYRPCSMQPRSRGTSKPVAGRTGVPCGRVCKSSNAAMRAASPATEA